MPIDLREENGGVLLVRAHGRLVKEDYPRFVTDFNRAVEHEGKLKVLFDMSGLQGWNPSALWEEIKFDVKHFSDIQRLAVIGNKEWQKALTVASNPVTHANTRYFDEAHASDARNWLTAA